VLEIEELVAEKLIVGVVELELEKLDSAIDGFD
jgi:hypothetical protein